MEPVQGRGERRVSAFQREVGRRESTLRREILLREKEERLLDIDRAIARGESLLQQVKDLQTLRPDPNLPAKWTPIMPKMQHGFERFAKEAELRRLCNMDSCTRILAAVAGKQAWCVERLYAMGCPVDLRDGTGYSPLHMAANLDDETTVKVLLNIGVDPNAQTWNGHTPLLLATTRGGEMGACAQAIRAAGGVLDLEENQRRGACALSVPLHTSCAPRQTFMAKQAKLLGRRHPYVGQY